MMNTPSFKIFFNALSGWLNTHKTLLTLLTIVCSGAFTFITSHLVFAEEYNSFKTETVQALNEQYQKNEVQDAQIELDQVKEDIDYYISEPDYTNNPRTMQRLESLERRKIALEKKINS